jgi:leucyl aminopeptidase (aminopeptidase T)
MHPTAEDTQLAIVLLDHSLKIKPKEKVLITASNSAAFPLVKAVYVETLKRGAYPLVDTAD